MKRQRGRSRRTSGGNNNPNRHYESNGPDVKIRGSAQQVLDKYLQYARDAQTSGDRVMSEAYFQHAEHYQRVISAMQAGSKPRRDREDDRSDEDSSQEAGTSDNTARSDSDAKDEKPDTRSENVEKPARRTRRKETDVTSGSDPLKVIDSETGSDAQKSGSDEGGAARPARRRSYKKRSQAGVDEAGATQAANAPSGSEHEGEGVMKTISRGRSGRAKEDEGAQMAEQSDGSQTSETAAE